MTEPSKKDRMRPAELLIMAGGMALFVGLVVLMATRQPILAVIFLGVAFIVVVMVLAMLTLTGKSTDEERKDIDEQNAGKGH